MADVPPHIAALNAPQGAAAASPAPSDSPSHARPPGARAGSPQAAQAARALALGAGEDIFEALVDLRRRRVPCALCTVVDTGGSSPRKRGAHMIVLADARIIGTVGGGAIEQAVIDAATQALRDDAPPALFEQHLSHDLGMCCGGKMKVFIEPQPRPPRLLVFGAGHVAAPLSNVAAMAGFQVTVVDARAEWANPERFPRAQRVLCAPPLLAFDDLGDLSGDFVVIVTHDHALDESILAHLLALPSPLAYIGLIGSIRKRERFKQRLRAQLPEEALDGFHTPMGLDIGAVTPEEIAVSVVAELIQRRRRGETRAAASMRALGKGHRPRDHEHPSS